MSSPRELQEELKVKVLFLIIDAIDLNAGVSAGGVTGGGRHHYLH